MLIADEYRDTFKVVRGDNNCTEVIYHFNALIHKPKYIIGVFDDQGDEHAMKQQYNMTFDRYLTATAGRKFDHPIDFDIIPVTLTQLLDLAKEEKVDFTFATAAASSCMQLERKAQALATVVNRRNCRGRDYDLDVYGGVMFTLASNTEVNSLQDLKDKVIGAGGITMMGGGLVSHF